MRILWLTPTGERSAIGRASVLVIDELVKQGHDVVVVSSQTEPPHKAHEFLARTFPSVPQFVEQESVRDFDAIVAHFGDHFPNHAGCLHFLNHPRLIGVFPRRRHEQFRQWLLRLRQRSPTNRATERSHPWRHHRLDCSPVHRRRRPFALLRPSPRPLRRTARHHPAGLGHQGPASAPGQER